MSIVLPRMKVSEHRQRLFTELRIQWGEQSLLTTVAPGSVSRLRINELKRRFAHIPKAKA